MQKKIVTQINFEEVDNTFVKANSGWILPQLFVKIEKLPLVKRGDEALVSPTLTLQRWGEIAKSGDWDFDSGNLLAILKMLRTPLRSDILFERQLGSRYNAAIPLIPSVFKELRRVNYQEWDWTDKNMGWFVTQDILELALDPETDYESNDLIEQRERSLRIRSGPNFGTNRKPELCSQAYDVKDPEFKSLSKLHKLQLLQLWVYHPQFRHALTMGLPGELDSQKETLVSDEIVTKPNTLLELPW